jgi:hypothetical protein
VSNFFLNISRALHQAKQKKILSPKANQLTIKGLNIKDKKKKVKIRRKIIGAKYKKKVWRSFTIKTMKQHQMFFNIFFNCSHINKYIV